MNEEQSKQINQHLAEVSYGVDSVARELKRVRQDCRGRMTVFDGFRFGIGFFIAGLFISIITFLISMLLATLGLFAFTANALHENMYGQPVNDAPIIAPADDSSFFEPDNDRRR